MSPCPAPERLAALLDDGLAPEERRSVEDHLAECEDCRRALADDSTATTTLLVPEDGPEPSGPFLDRLKRLIAAESRPAPYRIGAAPGRFEIPGIEVLEEVGRGGMGVVYKARQIGLDRIVALKVLPKRESGSPEDRTRALRGAQALGRLQHPNVVQIFRVGETDDAYYGVLEFVEGGSLASRLQDGPWPPRRAAELVRTLAAAADHVHRHGIVHRDLKPANILMSRDGVPKIADFGVARLLDESAPGDRTREMVGSPPYMAPEQVSGPAEDVGPAADVHALGAVLYLLLTGSPPYRGACREEILFRVAGEPPPPIADGVPAELRGICLRCLEKSPGGRYADAAGLEVALASFLAGTDPL